MEPQSDYIARYNMKQFILQITDELFLCLRQL